MDATKALIALIDKDDAFSKFIRNMFDLIDWDIIFSYVENNKKLISHCRLLGFMYYNKRQCEINFLLFSTYEKIKS